MVVMVMMVMVVVMVMMVVLMGWWSWWWWWLWWWWWWCWWYWWWWCWQGWLSLACILPSSHGSSSTLICVLLSLYEQRPMHFPHFKLINSLKTFFPQCSHILRCKGLGFHNMNFEGDTTHLRRSLGKFKAKLFYYPWRRKWQPTPVFLPGESHGRRSLVGYSPQGGKESDTTEWLHFTSCMLVVY